jgi:hypothetical protein
MRARKYFIVAAMISLAAPLGADEADDLFKKSVRPLFERKCFECHSSQADELKGNLKLETVEQILKGGATGPAVVAGDTQASFLLRAIRYMEDDFQMPPSGRLPDEDIVLVEQWVKSLKPGPNDVRGGWSLVSRKRRGADSPQRP